MNYFGGRHGASGGSAICSWLRLALLFGILFGLLLAAAARTQTPKQESTHRALGGDDDAGGFFRWNRFYLGGFFR